VIIVSGVAVAVPSCRVNSGITPLHSILVFATPDGVKTSGTHPPTNACAQLVHAVGVVSAATLKVSESGETL
jgi:hypothetical protein